MALFCSLEPGWSPGGHPIQADISPVDISRDPARQGRFRYHVPESRFRRTSTEGIPPFRRCFSSCLFHLGPAGKNTK
jgi:hypothetical protein